MHLALTTLFRAKWSTTIHEEWIRNVLKVRPDLTRKQLGRTRTLMDAHVQDAVVEGYEALVESINFPDPNDRHVLAAAIMSKASLIITFNLKNFPQASLKSYGIKAQHPDEFVMRLMDTAPDDVYTAVKRHRASITWPKFLDDIRRLYRESEFPIPIYGSCGNSDSRNK